MYCIYSGMATDTSRAEATLNSGKIKYVALAIVELRKSEGISLSVRQFVYQSVQNSAKHNFFIKILWQLFESVSG